MQAELEREARLQQAIAGLYEVFARYPLPRFIEPDPCFPGFSDDTPLRAAPLKELPKEAFEYYKWKAITTWGNVTDYKHFLPRLLELATIPPDLPVDYHRVELWLICSRLKYAQWSTWPADEQRVLQEFIQAWWGVMLTRPVPMGEEAPIEESCLDQLEQIAHLQEDLSEYLDQWEKDLADDKAGLVVCGHLAHSIHKIDIFLEPGDEKLDWSSFFKELAPQQRQVTAWLMRKELLQALEQAFHRCPADSMYTQLMSDAHQAMEKWLR